LLEHHYAEAETRGGKNFNLEARENERLAEGVIRRPATGVKTCSDEKSKAGRELCSWAERNQAGAMDSLWDNRSRALSALTHSSKRARMKSRHRKNLKQNRATRSAEPETRKIERKPTGLTVLSRKRSTVYARTAEDETGQKSSQRRKSNGKNWFSVADTPRRVGNKISGARDENREQRRAQATGSENQGIFMQGALARGQKNGSKNSLPGTWTAAKNSWAEKSQMQNQFFHWNKSRFI
jgi:hypothetical protein